MVKRKGLDTPRIIIVKQEFVGTKSLADTFVPIVYEQLRQEAEGKAHLRQPSGPTVDSPHTTV